MNFERTRIFPTRLASIVGILALLVLWNDPLSAHAMKVKVNQEGEQLIVSVEYDDQEPASGASVRVVLVDSEQEVFAGSTDGRGEVRCPMLAAGEYQIVASDELGHRATLAMSIANDDLAESQSEWSVLLLGRGVRIVLGVLILLLIFGGWSGYRRRIARRRHREIE